MSIEINLDWCDDGSEKERAALSYAKDVAEHCLGVGFPFRHAIKPAILSDKEATKVRREVYRVLREQFPARFPEGHRFDA
jgi:hypothetical protein